jgi:hypothetical protein
VEYIHAPWLLQQNCSGNLHNLLVGLLKYCAQVYAKEQINAPLFNRPRIGRGMWGGVPITEYSVPSTQYPVPSTQYSVGFANR